jgi:hypothetical protein
MNDHIVNVDRLFYQKMRAEWPDHPWLTHERALLALASWKQPRRVAEWWWMDIEIVEPDTGDMIRYGRVSWNQDGTGFYDISITFEREGCGLHCFPSFRALSDAQDFVERLMRMSLAEAMHVNGQQYPGVVL